MGFLFDGDSREPDIWAGIGVILVLITVALLVCFLFAGCACAGPAVVRERGRPIKLIHFEIKIEGGRTIQDVKTWSYADENEPDNPDPVPATR